MKPINDFPKIDKANLVPETIRIRPELLPTPLEDRADPMDEDVPAEFIAQTRLDLQTLPLYLYRKIYRVLRNYKTTEIFRKGDAYMQILSILQSSEKPCDLRNIRVPFQNTDQLQDVKKDMIFQVSKMKEFKNKSGTKTVQETVHENTNMNYAGSSMYTNLFGGMPAKVQY